MSPRDLQQQPRRQTARQRQQRKDHHDLVFAPAGHLEMMMEGSHFEKPLAVGQLEIAHLQDVGKRLQNIHNARRDQQQRLNTGLRRGLPDFIQGVFQGLGRQDLIGQAEGPPHLFRQGGATGWGDILHVWVVADKVLCNLIQDMPVLVCLWVYSMVSQENSIIVEKSLAPRYSEYSVLCYQFYYMAHMIL